MRKESPWRWAATSGRRACADRDPLTQGPTDGDPPGLRACFHVRGGIEGWSGDDVDAPPSEAVGRRANVAGTRRD